MKQGGIRQFSGIPFRFRMREYTCPAPAARSMAVILCRFTGALTATGPRTFKSVCANNNLFLALIIQTQISDFGADCACRNGIYYLYFPHPSGKDRNDTWKIGIAASRHPARAFKVQGYTASAADRPLRLCRR
jgi:hypothetical protein